MSPGRGPLWAIVRYEFLMQVRRKALWITFAVTSLWFFISLHNSFITQAGISRKQNGMTLLWSMLVIVPIIVGFFLADRLARDRSLRTEELLVASPAGPRAIVWGKFLGATGATTLVSFANFLLLGVVMYLVDGVGPLGRVLLAYLLIAVPGFLFISAYSIACPAVLPIRLYQVLFAGYWLWNEQLVIPSPKGTPFDPSIPFVQRLITPHGSDTILGPFGWVFQVTPAMAGLNVALILGLAVLALIGLERYLIWREARS